MRIALVAEGSRGDVFPIFELAGHLDRAGLPTRVIAPPGFAEEAARRGLAFASSGTDVHALLQDHASVVERGPHAAVGVMRRWSHDIVRNELERLGDLVRGCDALIGGGLPLAARTIAELHGIPYRFVVYCPTVIPSGAHTPPGTGWVRTRPWLARALWRVARVLHDGIGRRPLERGRRALGLEPCGNLVDHVLGPRFLLAVDPDLDGAPADARFPHDTLGCLHDLAERALPPKLQAFLDAGPPPVYVGFGSMPDPRPQATTALLVALAERLGRRLVISRGWAGLGDGPLADGVFVADDVPHASLFRRVAAVVHHGGAGTTTSAARAGVPQLVLAHAADQFYWLCRIRELGLGSGFARRALTLARLEHALSELLDLEVVAERAAQLGERMRARPAIDPAAVVRASLGA